MAVVSQQSHLFNGTIRRNLQLALPEADDDQLWKALQAARLDRMVAALPKGLDTWIGEAGQQLSGGEARRLAVAQAVLRRAPLWLLDEPTEGLDSTNERLLMDALLELTQQRPVLLITHRPVALDQLDRIALLEQGRIVAEGHHQDFRKANARFALPGMME
jgi:ATP-binding cassette subfamily C protein CydC